LLLLTNMAGHTADNFWDKEALVASYSNMNSDLFRPNTSKILELAEKLIHPKGGLRMLDLASGTGNPAIGLAIAFPDSKIHASGKHSSTFGVMRSCRAKYVESASIVGLAYSQTSRLTCRSGASHAAEATVKCKRVESCKSDNSSSRRSGPFIC